MNSCKWQIIRKKIFIFCVIITIPVLFSNSALAYERPAFTDGLAAKWHPGNFCIPCHYTVAGTEKAKAIDRNCENCHKYRYNNSFFNTKKIDMTYIVNIHSDMVCIRCHVGLKSQNNITAADFHRIMSKTACLSCHTYENGTYVKPLKNKCSDCHSGDPHVAHGEKLEKMCEACHGEFGEQYVNKSISPEDKMNAPSSLNSTIAKSDIFEYSSLGQFLMKLIEQFTQIMR